MILPLLAIVIGLIILVRSADAFVSGAAVSARHFGLSPLLIGMVIVGFGTSAPEMAVSALASLQGNPGIALGNAYGSNITNIALILGLTSLISPITVHSQILRKELPLLMVVTVLAVWQVWDGYLGRGDGVVLLLVFAGVMGWTIIQSLRQKTDALSVEAEQELEEQSMPLGKAVICLVLGLVFLVLSSRLLVWGAVVLAQKLGVSDLVIGLTVVAVGTSLPELASSLVAVKKGEHDIALGNIMGSNLFNTLAVVGIAAVIHPLGVEPQVIKRDMLMMSVLTLSLFVLCYGFRGPGRINRIEGGLLLLAYVGYTTWVVLSAVEGA